VIDAEAGSTEAAFARLEQALKDPAAPADIVAQDC
jgi:hypothetical protein